MNREKKIFDLMEEIRVSVFTKWEFEKSSVKYWSKLLEEIPDDELETAFDKFMKKSKYHPTPAGILEIWKNGVTIADKDTPILSYAERLKRREKDASDAKLS